MKKFLFFVIIFGVLALGLEVASPYMQASTPFSPVYARVKYNNAYFYTEPRGFSTEERLFLLEQNYFVKIIDNENDNFYKVEYLNLTGYVKKAEVEQVLENPTRPYLDEIYFSIYPTSSVALRVAPVLEVGDENLVVVIPKGESNLLYYGKITGEEVVLGLGNLWYYCKYISSDNIEYRGYIYSPFTTNLNSIAPNLEAVTLVNQETLNPNQFLNLSPTFQKIMIAVVFLPTLVILYLMFYPFSKKNKLN